MLTTNLLDFYAAFDLLEHSDDLLFGESSLPHPVLLAHRACWRTVSLRLERFSGRGSTMEPLRGSITSPQSVV
jgi:hypothetical protein